MYTGKGDNGFTNLLGRERVPKHDPQPEAYGTVDEAQAAMGIARSASQNSRTREILLETQRDLSHVMAELAATPETVDRVDPLPQERTECLERTINALEADLPPLRGFIIPGNSPAGAALHLARTIVRRAERRVTRLAHHRDAPHTELMRYLNRLSSLLFALARWEDHQNNLKAPAKR